MKKSSKPAGKKSKLEPLSIREALSSPAVEGMFSFLDIRPEELLHARALSEVVPQAASALDGSGFPAPIASTATNVSPTAAPAGLNPSPGLELHADPGSILQSLHDPPKAAEEHQQDKEADSTPGHELDNCPGLELDEGPAIARTYDPGLTMDSINGVVKIRNLHTTKDDITSYRPGHEYIVSPGMPLTTDPGLALTNTPGLAFNNQPGLRYRAITVDSQSPTASDATDSMVQDANQSGATFTHPPSDQIDARPGTAFNEKPGNIKSSFNASPGIELAVPDDYRSLLVREVRYTVRRARLVQDGHTANEQKLYEYLWAHGVPYDEVSRRISIGFRTLAEKVRLARASAQKNLRALIQKLAVQVIEDFDVASSKPPTYRVFNYSHILERRESAGMSLYVRRTQAVRFVDSNGKEIRSEKYRAPGLEVDTMPGQELRASPGPILLPQPGDNYSHGPGPKLRPQLREEELQRNTTERTSSTATIVPSLLITALQRISPSFDDPAAELLWAECRSRIADCTGEEVAYYAETKAAVLRTGKIQNPVGFLITAVPKCFEGESFRQFRLEQTRLKEEQRRREEEERQRQQAVEAEINEFRREEEARQKAEQVLPTLSGEERKALYEQARADLSAKGYKATGPTLEKLVHERVIRNLAKRIISEA